ncbi:MAG: 23S rRNA (guanosine(2251)-2'-O)-methyltransferase RlmB [Ignavibacteriae bacterium]|nr:23S rRNA (guanosine(2251)-2'-O)-methyltransferase RlmB [Ignavibacteriota bacterium]
MPDSSQHTNIIFGRQPVIEALKSGVPVEKILILFGTKGNAIEKIRALAKQHGVPVSEADKQKFRGYADESTTQGVIAFLAQAPFAELEDLLAAAKQKNEPAFLLILDELEDPHNVGALIRTAECAGVHGVIVPKHHSASIGETVAKTSAGASLHVPIARVSNIVQAMEELKENGVWIIGTAMEGDRTYYEADYKGPIAIVVGNEGKGIRRLVKEKCDFLVKIPLYGKIESLNASVAGALVMFEAVRQQKSDIRSQKTEGG